MDLYIGVVRETDDPDEAMVETVAELIADGKALVEDEADHVAWLSNPAYGWHRLHDEGDPGDGPLYLLSADREGEWANLCATGLPDDRDEAIAEAERRIVRTLGLDWHIDDSGEMATYDWSDLIVGLIKSQQQGLIK